MKTNAIKPTTIVGIKTLANDIKRQQGIKYQAALDQAAAQAGFQNYRHAQNNIIEKQADFHLYISAYWHDTGTRTGGRETLRISLSKPWAELILASQLGKARGLRNFKSVGPDHLVHYPVLRWDDAQSLARRQICAAARTMAFIDATKLRPTNSYRQAFPKGSSPDELPGRDHPSIWYDKDTRRYLYVDEPYEASVRGKADKRAAWAEQHGFHIAKPTWAGMYGDEIREGGAKLYLVSHAQNGIPLQPIVDVLNVLPVPITEKTWNGESGPFQPDFISPGSLLLSRPKPSFPPELYRRNSIRIGLDHFRPEGKMPVFAHSEVGRLLISVNNVSFHRRSVHKRLIQIRGELDSWAQSEYSHDELPNEQFSNFYYNGENPQYSRRLSQAQCGQHIASMMRVKELLGQHYSSSVPLRQMYSQIDLIIKSLRAWAK